jgi:uncharacterized protein (TIRG00374 family)
MIKPISQSRPTVVRILVAVLFLIGIGAYVCYHRNELDSLTRALRSGRWYWLLIAAVAEAVYFLNEGFCFSHAFRLTGTEVSAPAVVPVLLGSQTLSVIVPSEFLADQSLFFYFAKRRGESPTHVALGVSLAEMAELISFMSVLLVGFLFLLVYRAVEAYEIAAGWVVSILCLVLCAAAAFLISKPTKIAGVLTSLQDHWNSFCSRSRHTWRLSKDWAVRMNRKLISGIKTARRNPKGLVLLVFIALAGHLIRIACLFAVIDAFGLPLALWKVVSAYAVGTLVWVASPIPGGIGLVEGAYSLVFVSLGITPAAAATLALAYRGFTFWLPLGAGIFALRLVSNGEEIL